MESQSETSCGVWCPGLLRSSTAKVLRLPRHFFTAHYQRAWDASALRTSSRHSLASMRRQRDVASSAGDRRWGPHHAFSSTHSSRLSHQCTYGTYTRGGTGENRVTGCARQLSCSKRAGSRVAQRNFGLSSCGRPPLCCPYDVTRADTPGLRSSSLCTRVARPSLPRSSLGG